MAPSASGLSRQPLKLESSVRIWQESFTSPLVTGEGDGDNSSLQVRKRKKRYF